MHMIHQPAISSQRLGINAYEKAQMRNPVQRSANHAVLPVTAPKKDNVGRTPSKAETKELKMSVLKSLQNQSNSGLVNIRDVATALDSLLKKS